MSSIDFVLNDYQVYSGKVQSLSHQSLMMEAGTVSQTLDIVDCPRRHKPGSDQDSFITCAVHIWWCDYRVNTHVHS
jgi:hypothetical protein